MAADLSPQLQLDVLARANAGDPNPIIWTNADASGHQFPNGEGNVSVWIENSGASLTLTFKTKRVSSFGAYPDKTVTIPATYTFALVTLAPERFTDVGTGKAEFTLSRTSSVRVAAIINQQLYREE